MSLNKMIGKAFKLRNAIRKIQKQALLLKSEIENELGKSLSALPNDVNLEVGIDTELGILFVDFFRGHHYLQRFEIDTDGNVENSFQEKKEKIEQYITSLFPTPPVEPTTT